MESNLRVLTCSRSTIDASIIVLAYSQLSACEGTNIFFNYQKSH